jgi:hypothetical protein
MVKVCAPAAVKENMTTAKAANKILMVVLMPHPSIVPGLAVLLVALVSFPASLFSLASLLPCSYEFP